MCVSFNRIDVGTIQCVSITIECVSITIESVLLSIECVYQSIVIIGLLYNMILHFSSKELIK